jgi:hypothetical protein
LVTEKGRDKSVERIFRWNGRRYVDSARMTHLADDLVSEMQRLDLWRSKIEEAPPEDFPAWIQFTLVPALRDIKSVDCPLPNVRGLFERARELLGQRRAAALRDTLLKVETELGGVPPPEADQPDPVHPGIARLQNGLRERFIRRPV